MQTLGDYDPRLMAAVEAVRRAMRKVEAQIATGEIQSEEVITERLAQAIRDEIDGLGRIEGTYWSARLTETNKRDEWHHGADLGIVLDARLVADDHGPAYDAQKGMLVQAKRLDRLPAEMAKLRQQVRRMQAITDASAIVIYDDEGIVGARARELTDDAHAVDALQIVRPFDLLLRDFLACRFGDVRLGTVADMRTRIAAPERPRRVLKIAGDQRYVRRRRRPN